MTGCTWAGCARPATAQIERQWAVCGVHLAEHRRLAGSAAPASDEVDAYIRAAHARGLTDTQIAAELIVADVRSVADRRRRLGLPCHRAAAGPPIEPRHGTIAGARQHYRLGQKPCEDCLRASRRASADRTGRSTYPESYLRRRDA